MHQNSLGALVFFPWKTWKLSYLPGREDPRLRQKPRRLLPSTPLSGKRGLTCFRDLPPPLSVPHHPPLFVLHEFAKCLPLFGLQNTEESCCEHSGCAVPSAVRSLSSLFFPCSYSPVIHPLCTSASSHSWKCQEHSVTDQFPYPPVESLFFFKGGCFKWKFSGRHHHMKSWHTACERKKLKTRDDGWNFLDTFSYYFLRVLAQCIPRAVTINVCCLTQGGNSGWKLLPEITLVQLHLLPET